MNKLINYLAAAALTIGALNYSAKAENRVGPTISNLTQKQMESDIRLDCYEKLLEQKIKIEAIETKLDLVFTGGEILSAPQPYLYFPLKGLEYISLANLCAERSNIEDTDVSGKNRFCVVNVTYNDTNKSRCYLGLLVDEGISFGVGKSTEYLSDILGIKGKVFFRNSTGDKITGYYTHDGTVKLANHTKSRTYEYNPLEDAITRLASDLTSGFTETLTSKVFPKPDLGNKTFGTFQKEMEKFKVPLNPQVKDANKEKMMDRVYATELDLVLNELNKRAGKPDRFLAPKENLPYASNISGNTPSLEVKGFYSARLNMFLDEVNRTAVNIPSATVPGNRIGRTTVTIESMEISAPYSPQLQIFLNEVNRTTSPQIMGLRDNMPSVGGTAIKNTMPEIGEFYSPELRIFLDEVNQREEEKE